MDAVLNTPVAPLEHGGPDALGVPRWDFSTNANACGPCSLALQAVQQVPRQHYPDPAYTALRQRLAQWHGVAAEQVVVAASASEFIHRFTALAQRCGLRQVRVPAHGYGEYQRAAQLWGLQALPAADAAPAPQQPLLQWACEPASPLGGHDAALAAWRCPSAQAAVAEAAWCVVDRAYAPLLLESELQPLPTCAWQLYSPNKALGLTGVRAAYAIAPAAAVASGQVAQLRALAASWPLGAEGVALLTAWSQAEVQAWLAASLPLLRGYKQAQQALCTALGWQVLPGSLANFFTARVPTAQASSLAQALQQLRQQGIKLRDTTSFGLPGHVRLGVLPPPAQQALRHAWEHLSCTLLH